MNEYSARFRGPWLAYAVLLLSVSLAAAAEDPTYAALRAARPDGRSLALVNAEFDRDAFHFTLNGTLDLLAPVDGTTFGAVFVGTGSYTLTPANEAEKRSWRSI